MAENENLAKPRKRYNTTVEKYLELVRTSDTSEARARAFRDLHTRALEFFNAYEEEAQNSSIKNKSTDKLWFNSFAETCADVLEDIIPKHYEMIFADNELLGFAKNHYQPSRTAFAGIQRLVSVWNPSRAKQIRDIWVQRGLPTYGFDQDAKTGISGSPHHLQLLLGAIFGGATLFYLMHAANQPAPVSPIIPVLVGFGGALAAGFFIGGAEAWGNIPLPFKAGGSLIRFNASGGIAAFTIFAGLSYWLLQPQPMFLPTTTPTSKLPSSESLRDNRKAEELRVEIQSRVTTFGSYLNSGTLDKLKEGSTWRSNWDIASDRTNFQDKGILPLLNELKANSEESERARIEQLMVLAQKLKSGTNLTDGCPSSDTNECRSWIYQRYVEPFMFSNASALRP